MTPETIGRYRILRRLGAGGMGEVYLAEDPALKRHVAIKVLSAESGANPAAEARLVREAQAAATLDHANVCAVYEVGEHDGRHYIAMQYVEGETLAERIARGPLRHADTLRIAEQIADALSEAHAHGIVHRDIKPGNVMLAANGHAKVLDFGIAKRIAVSDSSRTSRDTADVGTAAGVTLGTTAYMSPEQLRAEEPDARSDVFAIGCVMYELASGRQPFARDSPAETIGAVLSEAPPPLPAGVPAELQRVIRKCLEKDRERRYPSARDLLIDLRNLIRDTSAGMPAQPPLRRSKTIYVGAGLAAVALLAAAAWTLLRSPAAPADTGIHVLAILPLVTGDASTDYLGDGISESVINSLSQLPELKVLGRTTAFRYRGANVEPAALRRDLGVDAVLTGRVVQQGESLVVSAELTNTRDGTQIWGQRYNNRRLADVFAVQEEIARDIAAGLKVGLAERAAGFSKRYTDNVDAYRMYVVGREHAQRRTVADLQSAVDFYRQAIARDERYALAWAGLTDAYVLLGGRSALQPGEGRRLAQQAADRALAIDPNLAEANAAAGQIKVYLAPFEFEAGDRQIRRAIELNPGWSIGHQFLAVSLLEQGRLDEGVRELEVAHGLDPLSGFITRFLAFGHMLKGDNARALELYRSAASLGPAFATNWDAEIFQQAGAAADGLAEVNRSSLGRESDPYVRLNQSMLLAATGRRAEALLIARDFEQLTASNPAWGNFGARMFLALGDTERGIDLLARAIDGDAMSIFYKDQPIWRAVRQNPRFQALLLRMRIPPDSGTPH